MRKKNYILENIGLIIILGIISGGEGGWNQLEYNPKMDLSFGPYSALEYTRVHWMHRSVVEYT